MGMKDLNKNGVVTWSQVQHCGPGIPRTIADTVVFVDHIFGCQSSESTRRWVGGGGRVCTYLKNNPGDVSPSIGITEVSFRSMSAESHRGVVKHGHWQSNDYG